MQGLTFQSADHKGPREALAHARRLRQIKVAAGPFGDCEYSFEFSFVLIPKLRFGKTTCIVNSSQNYQGTDLKTFCQAIELCSQIRALVIFLLQDFKRNQQLSRDVVTPSLNLMFRNRQGL